MPRAAPTLAKLSRPRLYRVAPRERLFDRLDECARHPMVWIAGPPGAGKTTLVATYLDARRKPAIWYQVDRGDADPATFFYYLVQTAQRIRTRNRGTLPLFTPEYFADVDGFSQRFFRDFFACLPSGGVLVLDNFQEATSESAFHGIVAQALAEIRNDINLIVVSRTEPPARFARPLANDLIGRIGWDDLRLTLDEAAAVVAAKKGLDEKAIGELYAQSSGWAAGLVLMSERFSRTGAVNRIGQSETMDTVFNYFAGQIFDQESPEVRRILAGTALLPSMTVKMAEDISGDSTAGSVLERFHRLHLFTDRKAGDVIHYEYHALFRAFLKTRAREATNELEWRRLVAHAARLLDESGNADDALALYVEMQSWDPATQLILKHARALIAQGRWLTLNNWIAMLPKHAAANPWLQLWQGSSLILIDPPAARGTLEGVFEQFASHDDEVGQILAATGIVESCNLEFSRFDLLEPWIAVLERVPQKEDALPSVTTKMRAYAALMLAAMWRRPDHPALPTCAARLMTLLDEDAPAGAKADVAVQLLQYHAFSGSLSAGSAVIRKAAPIFDNQELSHLRHSSWLLLVGYHSLFVGASQEGLRALEQANAIAKEYGQRWVDFFYNFGRVFIHLLRRDVAKATPLLEHLGATLNEDRATDIALYDFGRCMLAQQSGEPSLAADLALRSVAEANQTGGVYFDVLIPAAVASVLVEDGRYEESRALLRTVRPLTSASCYAPYGALIAMAEAYSYLLEGYTGKAHRLLRQALALSRDADAAYFLRWMVIGLPRMMTEARCAGIEVDQVRSLIRKFDVTPESLSIEDWPWPVKILTLGRFAVLVDDVAVRSTGKTQRRPLDLLKFVVAAEGKEVASKAAIAALWPNFDGDADHAFESTLHRLRKLLTRDDAVLHVDGKLALNRRVIWVDAWALEQGIDRDKNTGGNVDETRLAGSRLLRLYEGHFLAGEDEEPWIVAMRDKLRSKFLRALGRIGDRFEEKGLWGDAAELYARGLEMDNLSEDLYRRLIVIHQKRGELAAAFEVYRRCRQMLSVVLGVKPSERMETLYQSLKANGSNGRPSP